MTTAFGPVRRQAFGEQITEHLRDAIVRGALPVGHRLVEEHLAEQFGVSRGPIRDALRRLEAESLVESRGAATYVLGIAEADIDELYLLRQAIEGLAAKLAMERSRDADWAELAVLVEALDRAATARDNEAFAGLDTQFHSLIYAHSGHRRLADIWDQYAPILTTLIRGTFDVDSDLQEKADKHRFLLELMMSGDHPAVAAELHDHLEDSRKRMLDAHRKATGVRVTTARP